MMNTKQRSKRNLFTAPSFSSKGSGSATTNNHIGEIDPKRRSEIQATAPHRPENFQHVRQNGGEIPVPRPPPADASSTVSPVPNNKAMSQNKMLEKAMGFVGTSFTNRSSNDSNHKATRALASPRTTKTKKTMAVSNRRQGQQDQQNGLGRNSNSTEPSTHSTSTGGSEYDERNLISSGPSGVEFAPAAAVAKAAAGESSDRRDHDRHFPECQPGQLNKMSTLDENLRGVLISSYSKHHDPDERPIVDESDYISLASTLASETISPLDEHETKELRLMRNNCSPKKKKQQLQDRIKMNMMMRKNNSSRRDGATNEERWMDRSSSDKNAISDHHPSPPSRRESLVRASHDERGNRTPSTRKDQRKQLLKNGISSSSSSSSPRDDSGIEVDEAIQVGFAVLRALKVSASFHEGIDSEHARSVKKDEIMSHLHSLISPDDDERETGSAAAEKEDALDEIEQYLDLHRSYSNSRRSNSTGSGGGTRARSSSRSRHGDDAPALPCRRKSNDDSDICNSGHKENIFAADEQRRRSKEQKTIKASLRPARFSSKQYNALDDAEDTEHSRGNNSVDMPSLVSADTPSLVSIDDSSARPDAEPPTPSRRERPTVSSSRRSNSCRSLMKAQGGGDDDNEIRAVAPKRGQRRGVRELRRSQSDRHIADADAAAGGAPTSPARSRSKSSRSLSSTRNPTKSRSFSNLNDAVEVEPASPRRGRREPRRSSSSVGSRETTKQSSELPAPSPRKGRRPTKAERSAKPTANDGTGSRISSSEQTRLSDTTDPQRRTRSRSITSNRQATPVARNRSRSKDPSSASASRRSPLKKEWKSSRQLSTNEPSNESPLKRSTSISADHGGVRSMTPGRHTRHNSFAANSQQADGLSKDPSHAMQSGIPPPPALESMSSPKKLLSNPKDTKSYYANAPLTSSAVATRKSLLSHLPKSKSLRSLGDSLAFSSLEVDCASVAHTISTQKSNRGLGDAAIANMDWQKLKQK